MVRSTVTMVMVICAWLCPVASAAGGPANGVHVDPGSPAGKQYAIPVVSARAETSGPTSASRSASPPLFGAGITPTATQSSSIVSSTRARSGATARSATGRHRVTPPGSRSIGGPVIGAATPSAGGRRPGLADRRQSAPIRRFGEAGRVGASSWIALLGGGALALALGCGGGLALRWRGSLAKRS